MIQPRIDRRFAVFRLEVRRSPIHRWGVFAAEPIPPRRKVIEYTGERISRRETLRRGQGEKTYLFAINSYWTIDGSVGVSGAERINHSCDPNLRSRTVKGRILYISSRRIRAGEELTVDYLFAKNIGPVPCRCRSPICRGTMNEP